MDRKLLVTLLQKNIQELGMITAGFMEMTEYPAVIIKLARQKTEDILDYVSQLEKIKEETVEPIINEPVVQPLEDIKPEKQIEEKQEIPHVQEEEKILSDELPIVDDILLEEEQTDETEENNEDEIEKKIEVLFDLSDEVNEEVAEEAPEEKQIIFEEESVEITTTTIQETVIEEELIEESVEEENQPEKAQEVIITETTVTVSEEKTVIQATVKDTSTIADTLNNKKIDDIRHAISIGDRFRFQRELFDGNGELMNKTLSVLNQSKDFDEAEAYLHSKFKWDEEDETVESFYQIVKRLFL